jgi:hypothetical protein
VEIESDLWNDLEKRDQYGTQGVMDSDAATNVELLAGQVKMIDEQGEFHEPFGVMCFISHHRSDQNCRGMRLSLDESKENAAF